MTSPDFNEFLPRVTSKRVIEARAILASVCRIDDKSVDSPTLAERLRGVSDAVSDIVFDALGRLQGTPDDADSCTWSYGEDGLQVSAMPTARKTGTFVATASTSYVYGASMSVLGLGPDARRSYCVYLPTDQAISEMLAKSPGQWNNSNIWSEDNRRGTTSYAYPFHNSPYDARAPSLYLAIAQRLGTELLAHTN